MPSLPTRALQLHALRMPVAASAPEARTRIRARSIVPRCAAQTLQGLPHHLVLPGALVSLGLADEQVRWLCKAHRLPRPDRARECAWANGARTRVLTFCMLLAGILNSRSTRPNVVDAIATPTAAQTAAQPAAASCRPRRRLKRRPHHRPRNHCRFQFLLAAATVAAAIATSAVAAGAIPPLRCLHRPQPP